MRSIWASFFFISCLAAAQLPAPEAAFTAFERDAQAQAQLLASLERIYPYAFFPLVRELDTQPTPASRAQFDALVRVVTPLDAVHTRVDWIFSNPSRQFVAAVTAVKAQYAASKNGAAIQPLFFNVQDAYVRMLAATYLWIEGAKREYLLAPPGPAFMDPPQRALLEHRIERLHRATQSLVHWMSEIRAAQDYAFLVAPPYFVAGDAFETRYTNNFFVGSSLEDVLADPYDLNAYLTPVADENAFKAKLPAGPANPPSNPPVNPPSNPPANPPSNPPANPPSNPPANPPVTPSPTNPTNLVEWQKAWDEIQRKIAQSPDDATLRQRLWELEQLKGTLPPGPSAAPTPTPSATPTPAPAAPPRTTVALGASRN